MATPKPPASRVIGKGLTEKRGRLVRLLDGHVRCLATLEGLAPWTPPVRGPYPARQLPSYHQRHTPAYVFPRERPELARPCPGPEAITDEEIKDWLAADPFVRGGLSPRTQRAMAFIATFAPRKDPAALTELAGIVG